MIAAVLLTFISLLIWLVLLFGRGWFWLCRERDSAEVAMPSHWPSVTAVVPARNEADGIAECVRSLLAQDYPGPFKVIVVDDQSEDGTSEVVKALGDARLEVLSGAPHPKGWTGKLFAVSQGVAKAGSEAEYLWLTDADIAHTPDNLRNLVARAEAGKYVLVSLMAKLNCTSFAERFLIPAFVFFFDMLYPFGWVNNVKRKTAGAAGGCMLIKRTALEQAGGIESIRAEIIDDCAMGRRMKSVGPIWLGLTNRALSLRPYPKIEDIRGMVARSAYAQLQYSPLLLLGTVIGMALLYILPLAGLFIGGLAALFGALAWAAMTIAFQPMLHFYGRSPFWGLALPVIGVFYAGFTIDSAVQHWRGRGGMWKGRAQAQAGS
ncbi:hopene-associated glycosyltransferase HpnB [Rhizomicrobium palustre]|uniref:Hopene-associated glycosyltransferase HpnB n=1 Tax=Rhizomicrobium palustre TaxID=189966 RepID=A0A846MZC7_9PROT|nr:glycosyltransferase [Rhizomicrobium palustre]NIK88796.1 hopene-associated glycosyltransferase HpnB [Rhizomicrobium palustre]